MGQRNLIIIMLLGTLGLRTQTLISLNVEDIDVHYGLVWIREKGNRQRHMALPHCISKIIQSYLQSLERKKRISPRTLHMNDELIEILCQYLALQDQFCNSWLTPSLFVSKKGNRLAIRTMEDNLKKILLYVPFEVPFNISCHTLRHSMVYPPLEGFPSE